LVGRVAELAVLDRAFGRVRGGQSVVLLVGGEAGVGKTRLVEEAAGRGSMSGARVLWGGCVGIGGEALPFMPVISALRDLAQNSEPDELRRLLGPARVQLSRLLPELAPEGSPAGAEGEPSSQLFERLLDVVGRLAAERPLILVVEDVHWADRSTLDLLAFLARALRSERVLIVVTYRADELNRLHPLLPVLAELDRVRTVERLEVVRFERGEVNELLTNIVGACAEPTLLDRVLERSGGNAFFVEELARAYASGRGTALLPTNLREVVLSRLVGLSEPAQRALQVLAVGGHPLGHGLLATVSGLDHVALDAVLREAVQQSAVTVDGDRYTFRHALTQEAVYADILPGERVRLHHAFAGSPSTRTHVGRGDDGGGFARLSLLRRPRPGQCAPGHHHRGRRSGRQVCVRRGGDAAGASAGDLARGHRRRIDDGPYRSRSAPPSRGGKQPGGQQPSGSNTPRRGAGGRRSWR
jgi:predicted ATPase